eukprot:Em0004g704a
MGVSPAELLLGRKPRTLLDNLHPDLSMKVSRSQERQKIAGHDKHSRHHLFQIGDTVYVKNFRNTPEWLPGVVSGFSELALLIKLLNGKETSAAATLTMNSESAITENGTDLLSEDFVADLLIHSAPETRAVAPRVNNLNEAMQEETASARNLRSASERQPAATEAEVMDNANGTRNSPELDDREPRPHMPVPRRSMCQRHPPDRFGT